MGAPPDALAAVFGNLILRCPTGATGTPDDVVEPRRGADPHTMVRTAVTARLAIHPSLDHASIDLSRLHQAGVDVEVVAGDPPDPLTGVLEGSLDLALVGIDALRGRSADGLTTVAVLPRDEFRDVLISVTGGASTLAKLPPGARVGVHGERRAAFLAVHRPDVEGVPLGSSDAGMLQEPTLALDAAVVGAAEARRAGLTDQVTEALDPRAWLPEPGKGALALVARHPIAEATALDHLPTRTALRTELALLEALDARSDAPLGAIAQPSGRWIRLWAAAASEDGRRLVRSDLTGPLDEPEALGGAVARQLVERGIGLVLEPVG